ncbi:concanavalin A-like lectin/glucanase domain-containing protein [Baffinella frigidus]|nr:concanavalin A-like lectin/glucanase domain-containing protein [Cryptophyta sp. CCMP2293]
MGGAKVLCALRRARFGTVSLHDEQVPYPWEDTVPVPLNQVPHPWEDTVPVPLNRVTVPHPWEDTVPKPLDQLTVEAWVKDCAPAAVNGYFGAISNANDPAAKGAGGVWGDLSGGAEPAAIDSGFMLGMYKQQFAFGVASEGTGRMEWLQAPEHVTKDATCEWVHVAGTYDGATMFIYVNGEYAHCSTTQSGAVKMPEDPIMLIGGYYNAAMTKGKPESVAGTFTGQLDEIRFWTVARTQDEIRGSLATTLVIPVDGLAIYFRFDGQASASFYKICSEVLDMAYGCGPPAGPGDHSLLNPDFFHTGFNPSKSSYISQPLEDCGPNENDCGGQAYNNRDFNKPGWY